MSRTLNKVMLIGNVGKDPELKYTPSGIPVTSFRLATSETWKDRDGKVQEHTDWHSVVAWRGLAEVIQKIIRKGSRVYIEGKIQTRTFDDKSGAKRHVVEVLAENLLLLDVKKEEAHDLDFDFKDYSSTVEPDFDIHDSNSFDSHHYGDEHRY